MFSQFIISLVAACKAFNKLSVYIDQFIAEWIMYDVTKIGDESDAKKEEYAVINAKFKASTTDVERRALLRILARLR